jgi:hypothetical protein
MKSSRFRRDWLLPVVVALAVNALAPSGGARARAVARARCKPRLRPVGPRSRHAGGGPRSLPDERTPPKALMRGRSRPQRLDDDFVGAGAVHDLPGLALFYGGLVRRKNVLSVLAQCLGITGLVAILWWAFGYSFVFAGGDKAGPIIGDFTKHAFLNGVDSTPNTDYSYWVSHNVFSMYQLMFAIITPALIIGAIAERMKFSAILLFMTLWMLSFTSRSRTWSGASRPDERRVEPGGQDPAIDFAGGTVVHMSSGWSALILCLILGQTAGFPERAHAAAQHGADCMVGTGMLWVGWYGFNAGSAVASDVIAANAFTATTLATAVASFTGRWRMDHARQAQRARLLLGRRGGPGRHHAGLRFRDLHRCRHHRRPGRHHSVLCGAPS